MAAVTPDTNDDVEAQLLDEMGIPYTVRKNVALSEIDTDASLRNQARLGDLTESAVGTYFEALKAGKVLPPLIGSLSGAGKIVIRSGRHRHEALVRLERPIPKIYICDPATPKNRLYELTALANVGPGHGLPTDEEERMEQALHFIDRGMSSVDAAAKLYLNQSKLERRATDKDAKRRAVTAGIAPADWDKLNKGIKAKLNVVHTDEGFTALAQLAVKAGLTSEEVTEIVDTINVSKSGERQKKTVEELQQRAYAKRITAGGNTYVKRQGIRATPRTAAEAALTRLLHAAEIKTLMEYYPESDRGDTLARIEEGIKFLEAFKAALRGS